MNNNQLKQLAWSAYLKGGGHQDNYKDFIIWYAALDGVLQSDIPKPYSRSKDALQSQSLPAEQPEKEGKHVCCGMIKNPDTEKYQKEPHTLCAWNCQPVWQPSKPEGKAGIKQFVSDWMDSHEPGTFATNEHGQYIYSCGAVSLNLKVFFEELLEEYANPLLHKIEVLKKKLYMAESLCKEQDKTIKMLNDALPDVGESKEWISVDNPPKESGRYLCVVEEQSDLGLSRFIWNCSYSERHGFMDSLREVKVTYWMPLPALPTPPQK